MMRTAWQQDCEVAGHIVSTVREQRGVLVLNLLSYFHSTLGPSGCISHYQTSLKEYGSSVILSPVKLRVKSSRHTLLRR